MLQRKADQPATPASARLNALSPLDAEARGALEISAQRPRRFRPRQELLTEGREITETILVMNGWAARVRLLEDGRRQIVNFVLPGDLIGKCDYDRPVALSTIIALVNVETCIAPDPKVSPTLVRCYALSRAHEEAHLLSQITRLGRLNAQERLADLLLELLERLQMAGLAADGRFLMPITQEIVADALGLTSVHVNRTLQGLRQEGLMSWRKGELKISNLEALRRLTGRVPLRVSAI